jgi:RNA polymerase sigma factor (sigma-70 family)
MATRSSTEEPILRLTAEQQDLLVSLEEYKPRICARIRDRFPWVEEDDIWQDVQARVGASVSSGSEAPRPENGLEPWLWTVTWRVATDSDEKRRCRSMHEKRYANSGRVRDVIDPPTELDQIETSEALTEAVTSLVYPLRVVVWRVLEGCTLIKIAADLGLPYGRVRRRFQKARALLRAKLEARFEDFC